MGNLNDNPYDLNSVANPYGRYGSEYSLHSVNNPDGFYGSEYSLKSPNNPYTTSGAPRIYSSDGRYLGMLSRNSSSINSTANEYGTYGSSYSLNSINNPDGIYGSEYSLKSATYLYGKSFFEEKEISLINDRLISRNKYLINKLNKKKCSQDVEKSETQDGAMSYQRHYQEVKKIIGKNLLEIKTLRQLRMPGLVRNYKVPEDDFRSIPEQLRLITKELVEKEIEEGKQAILKDDK